MLRDPTALAHTRARFASTSRVFCAPPWYGRRSIVHRLNRLPLVVRVLRRSAVCRHGLCSLASTGRGFRALIPGTMTLTYTPKKGFPGSGTWSTGSQSCPIQRSIGPTGKRSRRSRPAVSGKVWGGNRTRTGANTQPVLVFVFEAFRRHARAVRDCVSATLRAWGNRRLQVLPPVR
jgi:hypothetical protein